MGVISTQGFTFRLLAGEPYQQLDIFEDEDILMSNNVTGLFDIGVLPSDFTRQITLPGTKVNNAFFEHVYDISIDSPFLFATNVKVPALFEFDSVFLSQGYLQLNKVNVIANKFIDSYEVTIFGTLSSFARTINRSFLTDLTGSLSEYNHTASLQNITGSWSGSLFGGDIVYPLAEYGQQLTYTSFDDRNGIDSPRGALTVQDFKPAIRIKKVWDAIFDFAGYTYTSSFWEEPFLDDAYMVCNNNLRYPVFPPNSYGLSNFNIETYGLYKISPISGSGTNILLNKNAYNNLPWYNIESNPSNILSSSLEWNYAFDTNLRGTINLNFEIAPSGSAISGSGYGVPQFSLVVQGLETSTWVDYKIIPLENINLYMQQINAYNQGDTRQQSFELKEQFDSSFNGLTVRYTIPKNTQLRWQLLVESLNPSVNRYTVTLDKSNIRSYLELTKTNQAGDRLIMNIGNNMPFGTTGIKMIDFIKGVQEKYNLVIYPSKTKENQFIVETFNDWYNKGEVKDFNRYINLDEKIEVIPANNLAVNKLNFGDTLDGDYLSQQFSKQENREFGKQYYIDTQNFFSQGEFNVKTTFASTPLTRLPGTGLSGSVGGITPSLFSYSATRFYFGNTTSDCCIAVVSPAYYVPNSSDPIFGIPQYIYQDAAGTTAFPYPYFTDAVIGLPSATHNYNSTTGQVGSYVTSCL